MWQIGLWPGNPAGFGISVPNRVVPWQQILLQETGSASIVDVNHFGEIPGVPFLANTAVVDKLSYQSLCNNLWMILFRIPLTATDSERWRCVNPSLGIDCAATAIRILDFCSMRLKGDINRDDSRYETCWEIVCHVICPGIGRVFLPSSVKSSDCRNLVGEHSNDHWGRVWQIWKGKGSHDMAGIKKNGEQILTWRDGVCALLTIPENRDLRCLLPRNSISGLLDANDTSLILDSALLPVIRFGALIRACYLPAIKGVPPRHFIFGKIDECR